MTVINPMVRGRFAEEVKSWAKLLGMRPRTLHYLIQRHNIDPGESI